MANVKKHDVAEMPVLFGEGKRPSTQIMPEDFKKSLETEVQAFQSYAPKAGWTYRFPKLEDAIVKKQPVQEGGTAMQYLVDCESSEDGKTFNKDWFSLNSLAKRDAKQNPVHSTWYALGNTYERLVALCKKGELKVGQIKQILVPVFDKGKPMYIPVMENGVEKRDDKGNLVTELATKPQDVAELPAV